MFDPTLSDDDYVESATDVYAEFLARRAFYETLNRLEQESAAS